MVVPTFPSTSETFVLRQVQALGADVVTGVVNERDLHETSIEGTVLSLNDGHTFEPSRLARLLARIFRPWVGEPVDWSRACDRRWREFLHQRRPDAVLAQFGPNALRCLAGCRSAGVPLVAHFHGYDASALLREKGYVRRLPELFEGAAAVVVVSGAMRNTLQSLGCPEQKLWRIPCGVPVEDFDPSSGVLSVPCRFLAVGRFVPKKAPLITLHAFKYCAETLPGVSLRFVGDGPLWREASAYVREQRLEDRVSLLGRQPSRVVCEELRRASVFVQHSVTAPNGDTEGWPVSIAEAAASGLPVVSTSHAGIPEEVVDGESGFLVDETDVRAMADRMLALARDTSLRARMGAAGRKHIEKEGNFRVQLELLKGVLDAAVGARGTPGEVR